MIRHAARRPVDECRRERLGQRIFGGGDVAHPMREKGDQLAVALPGRRFRGPASLAVAFPRHRLRPGYIAQIGRTSTTPWLAPGQRAAQESAASRSGTSIM